MDSIDGLMVIFIMGSFLISLGKDMVRWYGIQVKCIKGNGKMVCKMGLGSCFFNKKDLKWGLFDSQSLLMESKWKLLKMYRNFHLFWAKSLIFPKLTLKEHSISFLIKLNLKSSETLHNYQKSIKKPQQGSKHKVNTKISQKLRIFSQFLKKWKAKSQRWAHKAANLPKCNAKNP